MPTKYNNYHNFAMDLHSAKKLRTSIRPLNLFSLLFVLIHFDGVVYPITPFAEYTVASVAWLSVIIMPLTLIQLVSQKIVLPYKVEFFHIDFLATRKRQYATRQ